MPNATALPAGFEKMMAALLKNEAGSFLQSLATPSPTSIRINPKKNDDTDNSEKVPWARHGRYLDTRPSFTLDPSFHAGVYYVQEASSMFLEQALLSSINIRKPVKVLDLCAAPGGKSTHLLSLLHPESLLVSNEVIRSRASILIENLQKWGHSNMVVTNNDPRDFSGLEGYFDLIVVDAPCSGEGMFRKDPAALEKWSVENIHLCAMRQRRILKDVWPALKTNGVLIYSTCTYNEAEDEGVMEWLSQTHATEFLSIPTQLEWGIKERKHKQVIGYHLYPHQVKGEGFFISCLRKNENQKELVAPKKNLSIPSGKETDLLKSWISNAADIQLALHNNIIHGITSNICHDFDFLSVHLKVIYAGTALATNKQGKLVPEHAGALCYQLNKENFPLIELTYDQALQYLRKEAFDIGTSPKGFALVSHQKNVLGWVNQLGHRFNNLYPTNWRIRIK